MKKIFYSVLLLSFFYPLSAQELDEVLDFELDSTGALSINAKKNVDLFDAQDALNVSLCFDIKQLTRRKRKQEYQDAILRIYDREGTFSEDTVRIRARGERRLEHCHFPPIKFNFKHADDLENFDDQPSLKFVTHCNKSKVYKSYVFKEFLVYKLYNLVSDLSFRVRLVSVDYIDASDSTRAYSKYGFLVENLNTLVARSNALRLKEMKCSRKHMDKKHLVRMAVFQYMIGNTDWSVAGQHNVRILKLIDEPFINPVPVPYDFDYSGLVNTYYAVPAEGLGIESVRERYYEGVCVPDTMLMEEIGRFLELKDEFYSTIQNFPLLDDKDKNDVISFLDSFFQIAENEKAIRKYLINNCYQ